MARPTKATEKIIQRLCDALSLGCTYELACKYAGIGASTLRMWRAHAAQAAPGTRAHRLIERLDEAESKAVMRWLGHLEQAARDGHWQASAWKLERRYFSEYGRHIVQHDGEVHLTGHPEWQVLRQQILSALAAYPEAKVLLADVLSGEGLAGEEHRNGATNGTGH